DGIVPGPGFQIVVIRMSGREDPGDAFSLILGLLKHRKLVRPLGLVFMNAGFHVPTSKIPAIGSRKGTGTEAANGSALPVTVIDVGRVERGLFRAGVCQRSANGALPRRFGDVVVAARDADAQDSGESEKTCESFRLGHETSTEPRRRNN